MKTEPIYKVGDTIEVIAPCKSSNNRIGQTGLITESRYDGLDGFGEGWVYKIDGRFWEHERGIKLVSPTPSHSEETETTAKHTPTPWRVGVSKNDHKEDNYVTIEHGENPTHAICRMTTWGQFGNEGGEANAQLIVTAVNSYHQLKSENERLKVLAALGDAAEKHVEILQSDNEAKEKRISELELLLKEAYKELQFHNWHNTAIGNKINADLKLYDELDSH